MQILSNFISQKVNEITFSTDKMHSSLQEAVNQRRMTRNINNDSRVFNSSARKQFDIFQKEGTLTPAEVAGDSESKHESTLQRYMSAKERGAYFEKGSGSAQRYSATINRDAYQSMSNPFLTGAGGAQSLQISMRKQKQGR